MTLQEKLELLEETMDVEEGALTKETVLADLDEWDSMTKLSIIVMMDDEFGKTIKADDIKRFVTVNDILNCME